MPGCPVFALGRAWTLDSPGQKWHTRVWWALLCCSRLSEVWNSQNWTSHDHLLEFKPSSFWGPFLPPAPECCLFLRGSLNIIALTGQGVEEWVIRKTVTTCGHPHWPLFRITALVASGKPFIGALGVSPTWPRMILSSSKIRCGIILHLEGNTDLLLFFIVCHITKLHACQEYFSSICHWPKM